MNLEVVEWIQKFCQLSGCDMIIGNGLYLSPIDEMKKKKSFIICFKSF